MLGAGDLAAVVLVNVIFWELTVDGLDFWRFGADLRRRLHFASIVVLVYLRCDRLLRVGRLQHWVFLQIVCNLRAIRIERVEILPVRLRGRREADTDARTQIAATVDYRLCLAHQPLSLE